MVTSKLDEMSTVSLARSCSTSYDRVTVAARKGDRGISGTNKAAEKQYEEKEEGAEKKKTNIKTNAREPF